MKQIFDIDIFEIKDLQADHSKVLEVIAKYPSIISDFNNLMEYYENNKKKKKGMLFVCKHDVDNHIMYQHLVLFAEHYDIRIYSFKKDTKQLLEKLLNRKKVFLVYCKSVCDEKCKNCSENSDENCEKDYKELEKLCL